MDAKHSRKSALWKKTTEQLNQKLKLDFFIFPVKNTAETSRLRVPVSPRNETFIRDFLALKVCEESKKTY